MTKSAMKTRLKESLAIIGETAERGETEWVADNYYLIHRYKDLPQKGGCFRYPEAAELMAAYLAEQGWKCDEESLCRHLRERSAQSPLSYGVISAIPAALAYCTILRIGDICRGEKNAALLPETIGVLRELSEVRKNELFAYGWQAEEVLEEQEESYPLCSEETKAAYRAALAKRARKNRRGEKEEALRVAKEAKSRDTAMGNLLFPRRVSALPGLLWYGLFFALLLAGGWLFFRLFGWLTIPLLLPLGAGIAPLCDRLTAMFCKGHAPLRLRLTEIPEKGRTVVAVATLFSGKEDYARRLERFYYLNRDENLYFCLLADLPAGKERNAPGDEELIGQAKDAIDLLNKRHGERFFLLYRDRVKQDDGSYGGKERKRGAVGMLIRRLSGVEAGILYGSCPERVQYLLTLDGDTELSPGILKDLLGVALHPANKAYGVFQPAVHTELYSSYRTYFTRLVSGYAGVSFYECACFDRNMSLYGEGIFCGKGLIRLDKFRPAMELPEGKILSHDLPEGGIAGTLLVSDLALSDSVPGTPAAWDKRAHRWIRGDVQNLYFLFTREYPLSSVARRQILWNLFRHLTPVTALVSLGLGAVFLRGEVSALLVACAAYSYLLLPFSAGLLRDLLRGSPFLPSRALTAGISAIAESLLRLALDLASSAKQAFLALDGVCRSLWRMLVSGKKLLEWTTAADAEGGKSTLLYYLQKGLPGAVFGFLLFLVGGSSVYRLLGLVFFLNPLLDTLLSRPLSRGGAVRKVSPSPKEAALLRRHARDAFGFFADTVSADTHFLPPDNLQLSPFRDLALRTSPTNIGMYLTSVLAAYDLGFIDGKETADRLERTLSAVEGLPKVRGNLYNWYDLKTLSVLGDGFVSFVDSGNLAVCLLTVAEGLGEYGEAEERFPALSAECRRLAEETDLSFFYNPKKDLFSLGWSEKKQAHESGCYDLLMSEARTASYYAVARGAAPGKHWYALGRTVASDKGYVGMVSWSGTMFEYLMPQLFLPIYRNSFGEETLLFALRAQRKAAVKKLWGVSESGYYAFDGGLHYRYHAHGVRKLALRRDARGETVISPYSSYLALAVSPAAAVKNLEALEKQGMYGKYGLYEALDLTPGRSNGGVAVQSYMAHHVGMSITAVANALSGGIFVRRFMADPRMNAAAGLLQEKLPPHPVRLSRKVYPVQKKLPADTPLFAGESVRPDFSSPKAVLLSKNGFSAAVTSLGHVSLQKNGVLVNECRTERFSAAHTLTVAFPEDGLLRGCTPFFGEGEYAFETDGSSASLISSAKHFSGKVQFSFCKKGDCFRAEAVCEHRKPREVLFAFEPVLEEAKAYDAHPAFSKLFIESEFDQEKKILYFSRRGRKNGKTVRYLAVALKEDLPFSFTTCKDGFPAESLNRPHALAAPPDGKTGVCVDPFCLLRTSPAPNGKATLLIAMGSTKTEAQNAVLTARHEKESYPATASNTACDLLSHLLFPRSPAPGELPTYRREMLWKHGISGDFPLLGMEMGESDGKEARELLKGFLELTKAGIRTELIFLPVGDGQYFRPGEKKLLAMIEELELGGFLNARGGIFLLRSEQAEETLLAVLPALCVLWKHPAKIEKRLHAPGIHRFSPALDSPVPLEVPVPENAFPTADGFGDDHGYTLNKGSFPQGVRAFVLAGRTVGSIVTASSLGYTFLGNAQQHRLTPAPGDPGSLSPGEKLYLRREGVLYDLLSCAGKVRWGSGVATWEGLAGGLSYTVVVFCCGEKPFKVVRVMFSSKGESPGELIFAVKPAMGSGIAPNPHLWKVERAGAILFRSGHDPAFDCGVGILYAKGSTPLYSSEALYGIPSESGFYDLAGLSVRYNYATFLLGGGEEEKAEELLAMAKELSADAEQAGAEAFAAEMIPPIEILTRSRGQNLFVNRFLPYQIAASRFYARASFRQSGGAYGFRDQLQDCLALVYAKPAEVREHILRCCRHQYEEGDVQHWWHEGGRGIRTTCSDDLLWLPLVVADYVKKTGDESILAAQAEYIASPPLTGENERYELPAKSFLSETVLLHCIRAFAAADKRGKHGLLLMGICDWNDAFSAVGAEGKGESVFSTFLFVVAAKAFLPLLRKENPESAAHLEQTAAELLKNAEETAFDGDRYLRAFCDDGHILGKAGNTECAVDILSQAFALFAGADKARCEIALQTAKKALYDPRHRILKLFDPPFDQGDTPAGYVRGYPPGVRENGGQYTHAAIWGAKAFLEIGDRETALEILAGANPLWRNASPKEAALYRSEAYAMCADIYGGQPAGRGGWSFYTGSGSWYYKVFLEDLLGIRLSAGNRILELYPRIPYRAVLRFHGRITIEVSPETEDTMDGTPVTFPIVLPDGEHKVTAKMR